ncbi:MAG TPA: PQQ-binding-like beta-propeller repeat protein [Ktedonobacterales bacterium]|nr:PQQ-binding-like beta-propeller repeat protein [Ktedonobacterales bacterium]
MLRYRSAARTLGVGLSLVVIATMLSAYNWPQFNGSSQHTGANTQERLISRATVGSLHRLFQVTLPSIADGAPAVITGVSTPGGTHDLVFLTTKDGHILALDAHTGATVWSKQVGPGTCTINGGSSPCYTTSSPAVDPTLAYVYSYGLDGYVHRYAIGTGDEVMGGGWPELATLKAFDEKSSPALSLATTVSGASYLYVANGGYPGDLGDYQGHITAINLADGSQKVFNTLCSDQTVHFVRAPGAPDCPEVQSAVWAREGVVYSPATNKIYLATGNGAYDPSSFDWGDSVLALNPDGSGDGAGNPLDSYTPADYQSLQDQDLDLGSTAPALLPQQPGCTVKHLAVQSGKDSLVRLLDLDNLSGQGGPGHTGGEVFTMNLPQGGEVLTAPAVWVQDRIGRTNLAFRPVDWVFIAGEGGISGMKLVCDGAGNASLSAVWTNLQWGTSPIVADGILFYATPNDLRALDPLTGQQLWHDYGGIGNIHWESPVVANGIVYITDQSGKLTAYTAS